MFPSFLPCREARRLLDESQAQLIDVRSPREYAGGALPGAVNIPLADIARATDRIDAQRPVILYCRSGARSAQAQMTLLNLGFRDVHNLGGLQNYYDCG